jgi:hypothetical protein
MQTARMCAYVCECPAADMPMHRCANASMHTNKYLDIKAKQDRKKTVPYRHAQPEACAFLRTRIRIKPTNTNTNRRRRTRLQIWTRRRTCGPHRNRRGRICAASADHTGSTRTQCADMQAHAHTPIRVYAHTPAIAHTHMRVRLHSHSHLHLHFHFHIRMPVPIRMRIRQRTQGAVGDPMERIQMLTGARMRKRVLKRVPDCASICKRVQTCARLCKRVHKRLQVCSSVCAQLAFAHAACALLAMSTACRLHCT